MSKQSITGPGYVEVIVIALLICIVAVVAYDRMFAQKIKVVDLKGYLRTQKALLAAGEISQQQWTVKLDTVEQILDNEAAAHQNHVIVLKDAVLSNGEEISFKE